MTKENDWEYHSTLFEYQQEIDDGWANASRLQAIALNLGLNMEQFDKCMITDDHRAQVNFNMQMAKKEFGANSTPTFVIVGPTGEAQKIIGAHPYSTFVSVLDQML
jgi:Protein-disulfide isomerase